VKTYPVWIVLLFALLLVCGCATGGVDSLALRRADDVGALPRDARVGMTQFTVCGGSYLDKLNREQQGQDAKAAFFHTCTELGHPQTFSHRLRKRLEERLGRKIVQVKADKSFKPKQVFRTADKLGLDYVIAGDLLYLGEADNRTVVSALFYLIRVADRKTVVVGRVKKDGALGKVLNVIDDVADELFAKAFEK
jgi:signal recognition particle subunit SEC65